MKHRILAGGSIFLFALCLSTAAWAVESALWEQNSQKAFEAGDPDGTSITPPGKIVLAPEAQSTNLNARYAWSLAEGRDGKLFAGTGSDGNVFVISRKGDAKVFVDLDLQQVFALALDDQGTLYAGGFPGGKIYSINGRGEVTEFFDTGQAAVWALYMRNDGVLFAATGDDGKVFAVQPGGKGDIAYDSRERRILSLTGDDDGNVYAGSDQNGIIYKLNKKGDVSVLYDTDLEEVTAMAMDSQGNLYAVSAPGDLFMKTPPPQVAPVIPKAMQEMMEAGMMAGGQHANNGRPAAPLPGMPAVPTPKKRTCFVYKIGRDGAASKFWASPEKLVFSLAFADADLLAGSGDDGVIYTISPTAEAGTFYKTDQKQVLALRRTLDGSIVAGMGNDGSVVRFGGAYASSGTYYSQIHDAGSVSQWGRIFWDADVPSRTKLLVSSRSGNSEAPDDTWSDWTPKKGTAENFVSASPAARYIQWRAVLQTSDPHVTPELRKMTVAYLPNNLPPTVQSVSFGGAAATGKEGSGPPDIAAAMKALAAGAMSPPAQNGNNKAKTTAEGVKTAPATHDSTVKIQWQAQDENDDKLEYDLYFRGIEEQNWKPLKKELQQASYDWDTDAVPDGDYLVKVVASDRLSNPAETALQGEKVSDPLTIDNTAPTVSRLKSSRLGDSAGYRILAAIADNLTPVSAAYYSIDAGEWSPVFPEDGIFDSATEKVAFETGELEKGEHTVVLKAVDYFGNVGAGKIVFFAK